MAYEKYGCSNSTLKWMNIMSMLLSVPVIAIGIWLWYSKGSECYTFLQKPVLVLGVAIFVISFIGLVGATCTVGCLLWLYLLLMGLLILLLIAFTIFAFVVTSSGGGTSLPNHGFKEYNLGSYSSWLRRQLNDTGNWNKIQKCLSSYKYCDHLAKDYSTVASFNSAKLSPTESGCCRPPSSCKFNQIDVSNYTLTTAPAGASADCTRYSNSPAIKCFSCDSCKGGMAQYIKSSWKVGAYVMAVVLVLLIVLYGLACCAKFNADRDLDFERLDKPAPVRR